MKWIREKVEKSEGFGRGENRVSFKTVMTRVLAVMLMVSGVLAGGIVLSPGVFADNKECVETSVIGDDEGGKTQYCVDSSEVGEGGMIIKLLEDVTTILTIGVGILGVIGITIVGLQYLTAGGSEEKTRQAKRRMFEIVIGLVAYALIYAVLKWLLPTFGTTGTP